MLAQVQAARKRASAQSLQRAQSLAVVCGLSARAVERARLGPSGCSPRGQGAPLRPRGSFPRLALARERASIPAAVRRGVGARRRRAGLRLSRHPRSLGAGKRCGGIATYTQDAQTDESLSRAIRCPPRFGGACASTDQLTPVVLISLFPPEPQVNSLSVLRTSVLYHLHRQYVNQRLSSQVNSLTSPSASFAYFYQGCSSLSRVFVVAQFGQHNGGLVRRNSLLCNPGCPGHFGQRG